MEFELLSCQDNVEHKKYRLYDDLTFLTPFMKMVKGLSHKYMFSHSWHSNEFLVHTQDIHIYRLNSYLISETHTAHTSQTPNILKQILIPINYMFPKCFFYLHSSVWLLKLTVIHCFGRVLTMNWTLNIVYHLVKLSMFSLKRVLIGWTAQLQLRTLLLTSEAFWIDLWWVN